MRRSVSYLKLAVCICILLAGCSTSASVDQMQSAKVPVATPVVTEQSVSLHTEETVPAPTASETEGSSTEDTSLTPEETDSSSAVSEAVGANAIKLPVMELPSAPEGEIHFFDDAVFIGDSISYSLMVHQTKTGELGDALFLVRGSLGLHNTLDNHMTVYYQGKPMTPWDALEASGAQKAFLLLGMNDIGYYGIDATMEKWVTFLGNIREKCPDIQIYIQSLTPMWLDAEQSLLNNENIDLYNERLRAFSEENNCSFVDIAPYFKNSKNGLAGTYCGDLYVHMNDEGTAAWATLLRAYAAEQEMETP